MRKESFSIVLIVLLCVIASPAIAQKKKHRRKSQTEAVINTAKSYIGTPYLWGGNSKAGIDCSGLIHLSYKAAGFNIPRTAKEQSKYGANTGWNGLKPGDIVFFKFKENRSKWWHSGLITEVNGDQIKFIHASSSRGVTESNLMSDYYRTNVKGFRRLIK
jgi:probable lipoprotein NlpC